MPAIYEHTWLSSPQVEFNARFTPTLGATLVHTSTALTQAPALLSFVAALSAVTEFNTMATSAHSHLGVWCSANRAMGTVLRDD